MKIPVWKKKINSFFSIVKQTFVTFIIDIFFLKTNKYFSTPTRGEF